jgi:UDPglucose 6-dehydrogenase
MKIGICGYGFVGQAIYSFMHQHFDDVVVYDKYSVSMNKLDVLFDTELLYICVPTPYEESIQTYNMKELDLTLALLADQNYKGIILIKSTVLPTYCAIMNNQYPQLVIVHNPEFLSAATAVADFATQKHIILGHTEQSEQAAIQVVKEFYTTLFPSAVLSVTTSIISALVKLGCNSFYATKVQFFTELFLLCEKMEVDYTVVKTLMLNNQWINPMHTTVPGPDKQVSFGGACLPKDVSALNQFMHSNVTPHKVLDAVITERHTMRKD